MLQDIYDEFVAKAVKRAQAVNVGDPLDAATELGPQVCGPRRWHSFPNTPLHVGQDSFCVLHPLYCREILKPSCPPP